MIVSDNTHRAAEHAAREHYSRLLASLAARFRDVSAAEDALADSLVAALAQWPVSGVPDEPAAWLLTVARRRHSDRLRRQTTAKAALDQMAFDAHSGSGSPMNDRRLELLFACAHPAIEENVRAPLMLQVVFGLDAGAIAGLFLVSPAAMAQRLVRAKQKIRDAHIPFYVPGPDGYPERLDFVLQAIYALFTRDGVLWHAATGNRDSLGEEAIWLGDLVVGLSNRQPEALGLLALMLFVESRRGARRDREARYVPLSRQSAALWDSAMIGRAETLLREAADKKIMGKFQLEAAIQSVHCARAKTGATDWSAILALYDGMLALGSSLVAEINRALAVLQVNGAEAALSALDTMTSARVAAYQPYWAARAHILEECGRREEAIASYDRAIALEMDEATMDFLKDRLRALRGLGEERI